MVAEQLEREIHRLGGQLQVVPMSVLSTVREEWRKCVEQIQNTQMHQDLLENYFDFTLGDKLDQVNSLIIIALPSPPCYVELELESGRIEADIPPVYIHRDQQLETIKQLVANSFDQNQLHSWPVVLPKKILASISGFGKYGRNNLLYVEGLGSCHRLTVFASDLVCTDEMELSTQRRMERCSHCGICMRSCPTGAIAECTTIINHDRCLTFYNEREHLLAEWLQEDWHHTLVGCIRCQELCPANRGVWRREKLAAFSKAEVQQILEKQDFSTVDKELQDKLTELNLQRYYSVMSRNIKLLLKAKGIC
jgi:epoxyqueuosine reductase